MGTAVQFAAACESLMGSPFHHRGRTRAGIDCIGLVFAGASQIGVEIPPFLEYGRTPDSEVLMRAVRERCDEVAWGERLDIGRLLVLRQRANGQPRHFAVTLGCGMAVHVGETKSERRVIPDVLVHSVWRVRGINYEVQPWP